MSMGSSHPSRFRPSAKRSRPSLDALAERLTEAHFEFKRGGGVLTVRDSKGGRVEFQKGEDENDYRADVYDAARVLLINLVTVLQVYGLTAHFHFNRGNDVPQKHRLVYGRGSA
jgi:hypothetical protein